MPQKILNAITQFIEKRSFEYALEKTSDAYHAEQIREAIQREITHTRNARMPLAGFLGFSLEKKIDALLKEDEQEQTSPTI